MPDDLKDLLSFKQVWISMSLIALKDEKITKEEHDLILSFSDNIEKYVDILEKSLDDGVIDGKERMILFQARFDIMQSAIKKAHEDEQVSIDEFNLLGAIKDLLSLVETIEKDL